MLIKRARKEKGFSQSDIAKRAGIGRNLVSKIEKGDPSCEIGVVFELAYIVGVPLFSESEPTRNALTATLKDIHTLLPSSVRKPKVDIDDDF